jgi:hypothetical protein
MKPTCKKSKEKHPPQWGLESLSRQSLDDGGHRDRTGRHRSAHDREGFEPRIVRKRQRRLTGAEEMVLLLSARDLTPGEM